MRANHWPRARTAGAWAGDLKVFGDASAEYLERDPTAKERLPTHLHVLLGCTDALCFNKNAENNYKNEEHTTCWNVEAANELKMLCRIDDYNSKVRQNFLLKWDIGKINILLGSTVRLHATETGIAILKRALPLTPPACKALRRHVLH